MAELNIFENDAFGVQTLVASINESPEGQNVPSSVDGLFQEDGITTTVVSIEKEGETLALVPAKERGEPGATYAKGKREKIPFQTVHLPQMGGLDADEVLKVRAFGSQTEEEAVMNVVNRELRRMRRRLDATIAFQRICAIKGIVYDADGSTPLLDIFNRFGLSQQTLGMALGTPGTKVRNKAVAAKRMIEDNIGDAGVISGYTSYCGRNFFDAFVSHADVEAAYARWQNGEALRSDVREGFVFAGITWKEYYGKVGSVTFIGADDAYLVPEGVDDMFITRFAPANYMETVGTMGLPYYAKQEMRKFNKGVDLEAQSNVLNLNTRPRGVIKLTKI